ncbi:DUF4153 domain-containing protein [Glycomyces sp. NPDC048151]|uniref:DUF4153 domain-containing protein n=1 Tax=Glycomyces sp. NPDC048151 TaxID=3364002 RepID=UPI00372252FA
MSEPADSPAPRPEDAESAPGATASEPSRTEPPQAEPSRDAAGHRPETPMGDSRPETDPADAVGPAPAAGPEPLPAQSDPAPPQPTNATDADRPAAAAPAPGPEPVPAQGDPAPPRPAVVAAERPAAAVPPPPPLPAQQYARPLTPAEYQRQAAVYDQTGRPRYIAPPNPRWHRPDETPRPAVVVLVVAIALFGTWAAFTGSGVGIGLSLTGIAMVAVPLAAGDPRDLVPRLPGAVLVAALWSVAAVRDAGWVVFLCTAAAFLLTPLALAPQRRFSGTTITMFGGWLEGLAESFRWAKRGRGTGERAGGSSMRNLWVVLITVALLLVFGGLFAAADSTFADLVVQLLPEMNFGEFVLRLMLAAILFPLALVWTYTAVARPGFDSDRPEGEHRTVSRFELAVPLGALNLLFVAFIAVQLRVFFGGEEYVMETAGLTPAEYARQGFWQLSFVAALSLAVIAVAAWLAPKRTKADRLAARILLGLLCVLSMVVIASALYRMYTYAETFGLTRMRVWIFTVEIWLAVLFALVIVCCWKLKAAWLPRAVLASGALALLGLAAVNPDALIARSNIEHDRKLDLAYLDDLSDDAVPEFASLTEDELVCILGNRYDGDRELMAWNLGSQRAADLLEDYKDADPYMYCDWGGVYGLEDEYDEYDEDRDDPPTVDVQESYAPNEDAAAPPKVGFFQVETCESLDHGRTSEWLAAETERGLEPGGATNAFIDEAPPATAWLTCGYFSGDVRVEAKLEYTDSAATASDRVAGAVEGYSGGDWLVQERTSGYVLSSGSGAERQLQYYITSENLLLYALVTGVASDATAEAAAADLTGQMAGAYATFA